MSKFFPFIFLAFAFLATTQAKAAFSPLSVAILAPVQFPPEDFFITGARISLIYGKHRAVYGFDIGVIGNITEQNFAGIGVAGGFNMTYGTTTIVGLQAAGFANINTDKARIFGLQIAAGLNSNQGESSMTGLQVALANYGPHMNVYGMQVAAYNKANEVYGFQIGVINVAETLHGVQIGLLNFNKRGLFAVAPLLNIGF